MTKFETLLAVAAICLSVAGCETRPLTCGEYPEGGGPAVVRTRDQQVCEAVRMRVIQHLSKVRIPISDAEALTDNVIGWRFVSSLDDLYARAEKDAGPEFAAAVRRGVESVRAENAKPTTPECEQKLEKCLTAGAVKGVELAMGAREFFSTGVQPRSDGVSSGARTDSIDVEDLVD